MVVTGIEKAAAKLMGKETSESLARTAESAVADTTKVTEHAPDALKNTEHGAAADALTDYAAHADMVGKSMQTAYRSQAWSGVAKVVFNPVSLATGGVIGYAGIHMVDKSEALLHDAEQLGKEVLGGPSKLLGELMRLQASATSPLSNLGMAKTAVEGALTVVTIGGVVYLAYEVYRLF